MPDTAQNSQDVTLNRKLVGTIAIVLLAGAGLIWVFGDSQNIWTGACLKVGLVMGALWLALPSISRRKDLGQMSVSMVIGMVVLAVFLTGKRVDFRIVLPMLVGMSIAVMFLRPRSRKGPH